MLPDSCTCHGGPAFSKELQSTSSMRTGEALPLSAVPPFLPPHSAPPALRCAHGSPACLSLSLSAGPSRLQQAPGEQDTHSRDERGKHTTPHMVYTSLPQAARRAQRNPRGPGRAVSRAGRWRLRPQLCGGCHCGKRSMCPLSPAQGFQSVSWTSAVAQHGTDSSSSLAQGCRRGSLKESRTHPLLRRGRGGMGMQFRLPP